jgi:hypothetical protein
VNNENEVCGRFALLVASDVLRRAVAGSDRVQLVKSAKKVTEEGKSLSVGEINQK